MPAPALHAGSTLTFSRDPDGGGAAVRVGSAVLGRLSLGIEGQGTYRVSPVRPVDELTREALAALPPPEPASLRKPDLVELTLSIPPSSSTSATRRRDNFLGTPVYSEARAFMQRPAAEALIRAHRALSTFGFGLLIHDAYRPWYVTKVFWEATPSTSATSWPTPRRAPATTAAARSTSRSTISGPARPWRCPASTTSCPSARTRLSRRDRRCSGGGATSCERRWSGQGFTVFEVEWWHFDYHDWKSYPLLNLTFDRIQASPVG